MTKEIIVSIEPHSFVGQSEFEQDHDGYKIVTNKQEIRVSISSEYQCCEDWGYLCTNDNTSEFIGSELLSIDVTDVLRNKSNIDLEEPDISILEECGMFIDFTTDKGVLQIVVYNEHNGFYGHGIEIKSNQLNISDSI